MSATSPAQGSNLKSEAKRDASAQAHAIAELRRRSQAQARGRLCLAIAGAQHGLTFAECAAVLNCEALASRLLAALVADVEVTRRGDVYTILQPATWLR